ncbi:Phosphate transport system permease protein PstA [Paenibacillus pasadenensis]|uniref:Phosphate transport system permease protein PstA n=1 Tax=Paenibacillus pasadenensis TaxID=217090 RepID=A0A2N5N7T4_9BACL|nr:phosphate ABC transporter permease PstA [Paenibacillus pasadenensis]PLT46404.1 Phosphate transport system permease protein PstA [Paenibacillus pasadenensis]
MSQAANQARRTALRRSRRADKAFTAVVWSVGLGCVLFTLALLGTILAEGLPGLSWSFVLGLPSEIEEGGGIGPALFNSLYILVLSLLISIPLGLASGIYLAEFAPDNRAIGLIRICVEGLASVPSLIFGLFGIALFVEGMGIGLTIIGGAVTLALLNLPLLTRVTEEAMRSVPPEYKQGSLALGATHTQTIFKVCLPAALSSIMTGISLTAGRAFGESAVIVLVSGVSTSGLMWDFDPMSPGATLAVHLWYVQSEAIVPDAAAIASHAAAVLLIVVLLLNLLLRIPIWWNARRA